MERLLKKHLQQWSVSALRKPLLLRGARQTGKTYLVEAFAKQHFPHFININFELQPELKACFTKLEPLWILSRLELMLGRAIDTSSTLLFLDEIQDCPEAIQSMRYFKEKRPTLALIGAGSLLEFSLKKENFRMPVGRVESCYLKPMNFMEFLAALEEKTLCTHLQTLLPAETMPEIVHEKLLELIHLYMVIGGMPEVVQTYLTTRDITSCQSIQKQLLSTYRQDFSKYASNAYQNHCEKVFRKAPFLIAQHVKYVDIDPDTHSRFIKEAIHLLAQAGILNFVYANKAQGLPLDAQVIEKKFKWLFIDIGLVSCASQLAAQILLEKNALFINKGAIAEQLVGQELLAYQMPEDEPALFYWEREKTGSTAEIDYIIKVGAEVIPVEVKFGAKGRLKSLQQFMLEKQSKLGVVISERSLQQIDNILYLPFYLISQLPRLVNTALENI